MNNLAWNRAEVSNITNHAVVEARAHSQQHIAILHTHIRFIGAVHSEHADKLLICRRKTSQTHQGIGAGCVQQAHQFGQLLSSM